MKKRCILLVDDEQNILNALKRELNDWAIQNNLEIVISTRPDFALELLTQRAADTALVISDLKMPQMLGSDFLQIIHNLYPDITTMLLTGYSETEEVIKSVNAGIFCYMLKPWDSDFLLMEVQKAFEHGELKRQNAQFLLNVQEDLQWAAEMQKAILKPALPKSDGAEFRVSYCPLSTAVVSGDYYDVISLPGDKYLLLIGDVDSRGVSAAFITGILKAIIFSEYIQSSAGKELSPGEFLGWLNSRMNFELRQTAGIPITLFAGVLDIRNQTLRYANAGHKHPFIVRGNTSVELPVSGSSLGFAIVSMYTEQFILLKPNDIITLYTDGLTDYENKGKKLAVKPADLFVSFPDTSDFHRRLMQRAQELGGFPEFSDHLTILTARLL